MVRARVTETNHGLEWPKQTEGTTVIGVEISADMVEVARRNAKDNGLADRAPPQETPAKERRGGFALPIPRARRSNRSARETARKPSPPTTRAPR